MVKITLNATKIAVLFLCVFSVVSLAQNDLASKREMLAKKYPISPLPSESLETQNQSQNRPAFKMKLPAPPKMPSFPTQTINLSETSDLNMITGNQPAVNEATNNATTNNATSNTPTTKKTSIYQ